jgi:orotidine-5'-phosphate decarboxylase
MTAARDRLIAALDLPDRDSALAMVERLAGRVGWFKVGLELFVAEGPGLVEEIRGRGHPVFLDLKLHDIPNTVASAVRSAGRLGAGMLTLHASGGRAMLEAARDAARRLSAPPLLLAVTALTSLSQGEVEELGVTGPLGGWVARLAGLAVECGLHGLVCSAAEVAWLRRAHPDLALVVPGIRPAGSAHADQRRAATPADAMRAGASYLVVGRPILAATDPARAADAIVAEMSQASLKA